MNQEVTEQLASFDNKIMEKTNNKRGIERAISNALGNKKDMNGQLKQKLLGKIQSNGREPDGGLDDLIDL